MADYFVLVHGHICNGACSADGPCQLANGFLTHVSEVVEADPSALFERLETEGLADVHVLHTHVRLLFERPKFPGQPRLRQDCVGGPQPLIRPITRSAWEAMAERATSTILPDRVHFENEMPGFPGVLPTRPNRR